MSCFSLCSASGFSGINFQGFLCSASSTSSIFIFRFPLSHIIFGFLCLFHPTGGFISSGFHRVLWRLSPRIPRPIPSYGSFLISSSKPRLTPAPSLDAPVKSSVLICWKLAHECPLDVLWMSHSHGILMRLGSVARFFLKLLQSISNRFAMFHRGSV